MFSRQSIKNISQNIKNLKKNYELYKVFFWKKKFSKPFHNLLRKLLLFQNIISGSQAAYDKAFRKDVQYDVFDLLGYRNQF